MPLASSTQIASFATDLGTYVSTNMSSVWSIILVIVSIPVAFLILKKIITLVKHGVK